jgi:hypothetical protein
MVWFISMDETTAILSAEKSLEAEKSRNRSIFKPDMD